MCKYIYICSNNDVPRGYHTKWSKLEREGEILYGITYMWNLKCDTNNYLQNRNRLTDIENQLMITKGERAGER